MEGSPLGRAMGVKGPVDRLLTQQFLPPCLHVTGPEVRSAENGGVEPGKLFGSFRVIHGVIPETETTSHYFWAFTRNLSLESEMTELLRGNILAALSEDIMAAEAIEASLAFDAAPTEIHARSDGAGLRGRHLMQQLIDNDRGLRADDSAPAVHNG